MRNTFKITVLMLFSVVTLLTAACGSTEKKEDASVPDTVTTTTEAKTTTSKAKTTTKKKTTTTAATTTTAQSTTTAAIAAATETKPATTTVQKTETTTVAQTEPVQETTQETIQTYSPAPFERKEVKDVSADKVNEYTPLNYDVQKSVWISFIELDNMLKDRSEQQFRESFENACKSISGIGCNTIYVHVRAHGDAYYTSELFARAKTYTGNYDPLEIMVELAHKYKLSIHAWVNPLRCEEWEYITNSGDYIIKEWLQNSSEYTGYISKPDGQDYYWLNPAIEDVRKLVAYGVSEIISNYDVDGIHIDDYFYPTTDASFDSVSYASSGTDMSLSDWRLDNCSRLVKEIYNTVKSKNQSLLFGISPQGNLQNNYKYAYADVKLWASTQGYCDYIAPQIYFGYNDSLMPFGTSLREWTSISRCNEVSLIIGLASYRVESTNEFINNVGIISQQINDSFSSGCNGIALYSYTYIFSDTDRGTKEREKLVDTLKAH